jgi:hypothetical protein
MGYKMCGIGNNAKAHISIAKINGKLIKYDAEKSVEYYQKTGNEYDPAIFHYIGTGIRHSVDGIRQFGKTTYRFYTKI